MKSVSFLVFKIFVFSLLVTTASAQQEGSIKLKNEVFKEVEVTKGDGEKEFKLVEVGKALPGDEQIYITTFTNVSNEDVTNIIITNPISKNLVYKAGSAFGSGTEITFSVDGGKTYGDSSSLKVTDSNGVQRIAAPEDYTAIKWIFKNTLKPGQESTVTFRTILQ